MQLYRSLFTRIVISVPSLSVFSLLTRLIILIILQRLFICGLS